MKLIELFTIRAQLGNTSMVGTAPSGTRAIAEVVGGSFEGERLKGEVLTPGADWVVIGDGYGELDVRLNLKTDDGASIYMHYTGVMEQNKAVQTALGGGAETRFGDSYFVTQPRFECGHKNYAWLNRVVAVAEGRALAGSVEYRVYECQPG